MTLDPLARLKPIPTRYRGTLFRSKLESRVAQAMDRVGIEWEYEAQGYDLDGVWYLPDFWCPQIRTFVEVKGVMDAESIQKIDLLAKRANGIVGNPISAMSERLRKNPFLKFVAPSDRPYDAQAFDERIGVHVVVLPRADITAGYYAPSLCGYWGFEFHAAGSERIAGTVISKESAARYEFWIDGATLVRCRECSRAFWRARSGWWGCYACGTGEYPVGKYALVDEIGVMW